MKNICYHCKHAGEPFKVNKLTHIHCEHPMHGEEFGWETLREFWKSCKEFEKKEEK